MKKYLILAVAALGFAACAEKGLDNNDPANKGELEKSYVAITLAADDMATKAGTNPTGAYEKGEEAERKVKSAYVFFFKDGEPFHVSFDNTTSVNGGLNNYLKVDLTNAKTETGEDKDGMDNVSDIKNSILVLQNYKGEYPNKIVAVLNWTPAANEYSLAELSEVTTDLGNNTNGFVMSNAVYADEAGQTVDAADLTIANIGKTEKEALDNPVTIHVERVAAKVTFSAENSGKFKVGEVDGEEIYAQIKGFQLYNDYQTSWLMKRIDPTWSDLGFNWNDPSWFRSYWATSLDTDFPANDNTFEWETGYTELNKFVYCGENTRSWSKDKDVRTKVIVKAALVDESGSVRKEVVNWYGKDYLNEGNLLKVVANTLKNTYFTANTTAEGTEYVGLAVADIKCVGRKMTDDNAYEVYFQLSDASATKAWYKYTGGNYVGITSSDLNTELAGVQPALVYNDGMTYYYTDIKHLGAPASTAEYGVVRNHVYKVNIKDIKGFGTPVYDPTSDFIVPDKPTEIFSYVAAQINILSWRVVADDYELGE